MGFSRQEYWNRLPFPASGFDPWVRKSSWRREWQPTPVFLPGEFHGQRSLVGCSLCGHKELDTTEQLTHIHTHISIYLSIYLSVCLYIYTHTYTHTYIIHIYYKYVYIFKYAYILFQILFPCFYKILSIVPCAIQRFASLMKTEKISLISMIDFILTWAS